ncbi:hypothetical protein BT63DRAFT_439713 [Microthyrium microscopicum]|uniref:Uncharacterized protein n=1 Tax=Microthyrium microscopicum TaxID=703497 RepID=A0A6A6U9M6_9PEZI|nr:hypothetical protein BT63DRAFT_439713 [Microthyrium microscopicum]
MAEMSGASGSNHISSDSSLLRRYALSKRNQDWEECSTLVKTEPEGLHCLLIFRNDNSWIPWSVPKHKVSVVSIARGRDPKTGRFTSSPMINVQQQNQEKDRQHDQQQSQFSRLPTEVLMIIMEHLPIDDVRRAARCNHIMWSVGTGLLQSICNLAPQLLHFVIRSGASRTIPILDLRYLHRYRHCELEANCENYADLLSVYGMQRSCRVLYKHFVWPQGYAQAWNSVSSYIPSWTGSNSESYVLPHRLKPRPKRECAISMPPPPKGTNDIEEIFWCKACLLEDSCRHYDLLKYGENTIMTGKRNTILRDDYPYLYTGTSIGGKSSQERPIHDQDSVPHSCAVERDPTPPWMEPPSYLLVYTRQLL